MTVNTRNNVIKKSRSEIFQCFVKYYQYLTYFRIERESYLLSDYVYLNCFICEKSALQEGTKNPVFAIRCKPFLS